jgi:hypothetical protein
VVDLHEGHALPLAHGGAGVMMLLGGVEPCWTMIISHIATRHNQRAAEPFGRIRKSAMTFAVAARTSPHRAAFESTSIVPSISIA